MDFKLTFFMNRCLVLKDFVVAKLKRGQVLDCYIFCIIFTKFCIKIIKMKILEIKVFFKSKAFLLLGSYIFTSYLDVKHVRIVLAISNFARFLRVVRHLLSLKQLNNQKVIISVLNIMIFNFFDSLI